MTERGWGRRVETGGREGRRKKRKRKKKRRKRKDRKESRDRRDQGPELLLGPAPSTAAPYPKAPGSFRIFTIAEAAQILPRLTPSLELI